MAISAFIFKVTLFFCLFSRAIRAVVTSCPVMAAVELAVAGKKSTRARQKVPAFGRRERQKSGLTIICIWPGFPHEQHADS